MASWIMDLWMYLFRYMDRFGCKSFVFSTLCLFRHIAARQITSKVLANLASRVGMLVLERKR